MTPDAIAALLRQAIRAGTVTETRPEDGTARVMFEDSDGLVSAPLRVLVAKAGRDRSYWMPDVGERVLCLFLPYAREAGFILGAFYAGDIRPASPGQDKRRVDFEDGSWVEYDRGTHRLAGHLEGDAQITVGGGATITVQGRAVVEAESIELRGGNGGAAKGIVQADCLCAFTGSPHPMISSNVKGSL